jgi:hypothetical protein
MDHDREEPRIEKLDATAAEAAGRETLDPEKRSRGFLPWVAGLLVLLALAWIIYPEKEAPPVDDTGPESVAPAALDNLPPAPDIPVPAAAPEQTPPVDVAPQASAPPAPVLTLEESDETVREALSGAGSPELIEVPLSQDELLLRGSAFIDGLSRGVVLYKALSLPRPEGKFATQTVEGRQVIAPENYDRYDTYAQAIADLDTASLVSAFHGFRPLLEEAYGQLGYDSAGFDNALIRSLDLVITTPEVDSEVAVKAKGGVYIFADPTLESLPPLQKQLLRMGPDNLALVKRQARALRSALLGE